MLLSLIYVHLNIKSMNKMSTEVKIEVSQDGKKWTKFGTFLDIDRALMSLAWMRAKTHPYRRIKRGNKIIA